MRAETKEEKQSSLVAATSPWLSNQTLMPYIEAFWLGEDGLLEVLLGFFFPNFFFPMGKILS